MDGCTREKWILLYNVHPLLQSAVVRVRGHFAITGKTPFMSSLSFSLIVLRMYSIEKIY